MKFTEDDARRHSPSRPKQTSVMSSNWERPAEWLRTAARIDSPADATPGGASVSSRPSLSSPKGRVLLVEGVDDPVGVEHDRVAGLEHVRAGLVNSCGPTPSGGPAPAGHLLDQSRWRGGSARADDPRWPRSVRSSGDRSGRKGA